MRRTVREVTRRLIGSLLVVLLAATAGWRLIVAVIHGRALRHLALAPGMSVLDVGCGPGRLSVQIARAVGPTGRVVGVDVDPKAVRTAVRRAEMSGLNNVRFLPMAFGEATFDDDGFDRAVLVAVLGEMRNPPAAMAAAFRALKPEGALAVTEVVLDPHRQKPDDVRRLAMLAGFEERELFTDALAYTITFRKPLPSNH